jgi:hypothetical protein
MTSTADFDAGTKSGTVTDTNWDNIPTGELRMGTPASAWERWANNGQTSGVVLSGDSAAVEYRRAIKLNYTGEVVLYGIMVWVQNVLNAPQDLYVALLEPDGADCRPNGVSGVIAESPKVAYGDISVPEWVWFNFTNPVIINATSCVWAAFLTDGANPTGAYYLTYDNTPSATYREALQSAMSISNDGGSTWGTPTVSSGIQTRVLTVNYTTTATWESDTITIPSNKMLDSIDITSPTRFGSHEYRAPNNSTRYSNSTWPTSVGAPNEGQTTHPDIVDIGSVWNDHRYWACSTPLPAGASADEFPEIVASNNTTTFVMPTGISNPIWNTANANEYGADCDIVYDGTYLRAYWRYNNLTYNRAYVLSKRSSDGVNWIPAGNELANAIEVLNMTLYKGISPSVYYEDGTYHLWYVESDNEASDANDTYIHYRSSTDGENFTAETNITSGFSVMTDTEYNIWHMNIEKVGSEYYGLFAMYHNYSTGAACPTKSACTELYFGWSSDRENWNIHDHYPIIHQGDDTDWDEREIYRSAFLMIGNTMRIFYSAANDAGAWWISRTDATIQTRSITQVDFRIDGSAVASYTTDIEEGTTATIDDAETGNFDSFINTDFTILLTFSSGGNATPMISAIEGDYADHTPSMGTQYGVGANFDYIVIDEDTVEFRPEAIGHFDDTNIYYYWEFSDDTTSNEKNPTKTFNYAGITADFSASLMVCNDDHCSHPVEKSVHLIRWWIIILIMVAIALPVTYLMWKKM